MGGISKALLHTLEASSTPLLYDISDHWIARSLKADVWLSWWNDAGSPARSTLRKLLTCLGLKSYFAKQVPTAPVSALQFKNIYFCSQFMRDLTVGKGYPVAHAGVIYCGVDTKAFKRKQNYQVPRRFLWVGRLAEDKDPLTAVRGILGASAKTATPLQLDLYGKGSQAYTDQVNAEIVTAGATDRIQIKSVSHEKMRTLYADYDAYIFSSNWGEPFALTPLEAMASGLPVIMCPDGGDIELLEDGVNALGFAPGDPASLAAAIARFLEIPDFGKAISDTALERVGQAYSLKTMCDQIEVHLEATVSK
jgi:glycosyltransferase involved in cell wall biosynthesis